MVSPCLYCDLIKNLFRPVLDGYTSYAAELPFVVRGKCNAESHCVASDPKVIIPNKAALLFQGCACRPVLIAGRLPFPSSLCQTAYSLCR